MRLNDRSTSKSVRFASNVEWPRPFRKTGLTAPCFCAKRNSPHSFENSLHSTQKRIPRYFRRRRCFLRLIASWQHLEKRIHWVRQCTKLSLWNASSYACNRSWNSHAARSAEKRQSWILSPAPTVIPLQTDSGIPTDRGANLRRATSKLGRDTGPYSNSATR